MEEKLNGLTLGQAVIIGIVIAVLFFFIFYDSGENIELAIAGQNEQIIIKGKELKKIEDSLKQADRLKQLAEKSGIQLEKVLNYIPNDLTPIALRKLLSDEAIASGVDIADIKPSKPKKTQYSFIEEIEITVKLKGTFSQLMTFMSYLTATGKVITVKQLKLKKSGKVEEGLAPMLSFDASFSAYKYVPQEKEG